MPPPEAPHQAQALIGSTDATGSPGPRASGAPEAAGGLTDARGLREPRQTREPLVLRSLQPLQPSVRRPGRTRLTALGAAALVLLLLGGLVGLRYFRRVAPACDEVAKRGDDAATVTVCRREYARTRAPRTGALLANALRRSAPEEAAALARALLATGAQADALYVLGKIAAAQDHHDEAEAAFRAALELHRGEARWAEAAKDLLATADAATARKRFGEALTLLDECAADATRAGDRGLESYCHLGSARAYSRIGYRSGAHAELDLARQLATRPVDQLWIHLAEGDDHQDAGDHAQAAVAYERALALARSLSQRRAEASAHLNLAYSLSQTAHFREVEEHLASAAAIDPAQAERSDRWIIEAKLERHRGRPRTAALAAERAVQLAENEAAAEREAKAGAPATSEELIEAETLRAEIALDEGELDEAERWARRAIGHVELLRVRQPFLQLRSWVLERHRAPHEALFASLARAGRAEAALAAFDAWMAMSSFDALSAPVVPMTPMAPAASPTAPAAAAAGAAATTAGLAAGAARRGDHLARLTALLHSAPPARPGARSGGGELAAAPLLALVVAQDELWRLEVVRGEVTLRRLGAFSAVQPQLDQLVSSPADRPVAAALGELLLSPALALATPEALHVVLDQPLAYLPVAALRWRGRPLGALRPLVRALRPANLMCWRRHGSPRSAAVLADSRGDLPGARREAEVVATRFGSWRGLGSITQEQGDGVTREALTSALGADFLHLAMHAEIDELGGKLVLADGPLSALALASSPRVPPQVVLATCGSAVSPPGAYSLALGFLAAGADQVLATLRKVSDDDTARITTRLYSADLSDLVTALWRLQASAPEDSTDLSSFVVFGDVPCQPVSPDHPRRTR